MAFLKCGECCSFTCTSISHKILTLTKVNTYGLLYEWKGSDNSLKPLLLAAHQGRFVRLRQSCQLHPPTESTDTPRCADVVPVEPRTVDQWTHPPYSGYYDGESIWGRGSFDDKSGLIGILYAAAAFSSPVAPGSELKTVQPLKLCSRKNSSLLALSFSLSALMKKSAARRLAIQYFLQLFVRAWFRC